jgi:hypothetical protein
LAVLILALPASAQVEDPARGDVPVTYLYGSGTSTGDQLGWATAIHGDFLLVGARFDHYMDPPGLYLTGRVYAFERTGGDIWEEVDLWLPTLAFDRQSGGGGFGGSLALAPEGRLAIVGAKGTSFNDYPDIAQGASYVFRYDEAAAAWVREARLRDLDAAPYAECGRAVAVAGDLAVMNGDWNGRGLVVFRHVPGADDGGDGPGGYAFGPWVEEATFVTGNVAGFLSFTGRRQLAVADHPEEGERAVGGASYEDTANGVDAGAAYVYRNDGPDSRPATWTLEARIEPSDAASGVFFGASVALSPDGRLLLVGAPGYGADDRGGAYVLRREGDGAASVWIEEAVLTSGIAGTLGFGAGVALSADPATGEALALAADASGLGAGTGVLFRRVPDGTGGYAWRREVAFADDFFGYTVSLSGLTAVAGDWDDETRGIGAGQALVFEAGQVVEVEEPAPDGPERLALWAQPNPARGSAVLVLALPEAGAVRVGLYDALGRRVVLVHEGVLTAGAHRLRLDVSGLPPGMYLARAEAVGEAVTTRLAVVR